MIDDVQSYLTETEMYLYGGSLDDVFNAVPPGGRTVHIDGGDDYDTLNFDAQNLPVLVEDDRIAVLARADTIYTNIEELKVFNEAATLPGDTNGDGVVNLDDLNNVQNNFCGTGLGDTDFDGDVDLDDLNNVQKNFGATAAVPASAAAPLAVDFLMTKESKGNTSGGAAIDGQYRPTRLAGRKFHSEFQRVNSQPLIEPITDGLFAEMA